MACADDLAAAKAALQRLITGGQAVDVAYGDRRVRYSEINIGELRAEISRLEAECGDCEKRRRPFRMIW